MNDYWEYDAPDRLLHHLEPGTVEDPTPVEFDGRTWLYSHTEDHDGNITDVPYSWDDE